MNEDYNKFINDAINIIDEQEAYKTEFVRQETIKLLKTMKKETSKQVFLNQICRWYYYLLNNPVYLTLNKENINMLKYELTEFKFVYEEFIKEENDENLIVLLQILHNIFLYDLERIQYLKTNKNVGRTMISGSKNREEQCRNLASQNEALKLTLKR